MMFVDRIIVSLASLRFCWWPLGFGRLHALPTREEALRLGRIHGNISE